MIKILLNSASKIFMNYHFYHMKNFINNPIKTQKYLLLNLINIAKDTFFGKKYRFNEIKNYEDFISRLPLHRYEDLYPFIHRMRKKEINILWPGQIKWFAKSSGTTNDKSKYIPVTQDSLNECHYKAGKHLIANYIKNNLNTKIFYGKSLRLGGSYKEYYYGTFYGDISSILIKKLPFWAEQYSIPNKKIALINEWETKFEFIAKEAIKQNIIGLFGIPSWMLILLNKILDISKKKYLDELWPNFEVFFHGGINFSPYEEQYNSLFRKKINYYNIYNASEGFFAIQNKNSSKELLLLLNHGIFYEFIPIEEINNDCPSVISIENVKLHQNYALVISTNGGLWRYIIGDTVKFTSILPYCITISGRTKHFINAFGEELIIENAEEALSIACKKTDTIIYEYTAGPIYMDKNLSGAHEWIIEFKKKPLNIKEFSNILDNTLKKLNSDYEAKRYKDITLLPPVIRIARKGLFYDWFKLYNKLGGQNKIPRLSNNRKYLDILLNMK